MAVEHTAKKITSKLSENSTMADIVDSIESISEEVGAIKEKAASSLQASVKTHPYVTLGLAAALGYLIGRVL